VWEMFAASGINGGNVADWFNHCDIKKGVPRIQIQFISYE